MSLSRSTPLYTRLLLLMIMALPACDNDSDSIREGDSTAPGVINTSPVNGATGVDRSTSVTAIFNEYIFAVTVDGTSFTLQNSSDNNNDISTAVTFDGDTNIATLAPVKLSPLATYTATMTPAITDLAGNPLASYVSWSFTTADGVWAAPELVETDDTGGAFSSQSSFDGNGNALAVGYQGDGSRNNIWSNRYVAGGSWGTC